MLFILVGLCPILWALTADTHSCVIPTQRRALCAVSWPVWKQSMLSQSSLPLTRDAAVCNLSSTSLILLFFLFRLSTKPGSAPSILKSHSLTAERQFHASNIVWRCRPGVRSYCPTMTKSSTEASPASSAQVRLGGGTCFGLRPSVASFCSQNLEPAQMCF